MAIIKTSDMLASRTIGLLLVAPSRDLLPEAIRAVAVPVEITMPCGQVFRAITHAEVPLVDIPCPCGNPTHWLVQQEIRS